MDVLLNEIEARVLGALVEKSITTPDYYPLSLNALVNACNQRTSREPVMNLVNDDVQQAIDGLNRQGLAGSAGGADSRVTKYEHRLQEAFNLGRRETALLCVLLLRGPQTPGELRGRSERMYSFHDLEEVGTALQHLIDRQPPMARVLPRQPGSKELRYAHLLAGDVAGWEGAPEPEMSAQDEDRLARLESEVASLRAEVATLSQQLAEFRKQFE